MAAREEAALMKEQQYATLDQEVKGKRTKLEKLLRRCKVRAQACLQRVHANAAFAAVLWLVYVCCNHRRLALTQACLRLLQLHASMCDTVGVSRCVCTNNYIALSVILSGGAQDVSEEIEMMYAGWQDEKDHYMDQMRILHQQLRLKELVIDLFVPAEEVGKVTRSARWDDEQELWTLEATRDVKREVKAAKRPVSASGLRRPTTDFTKTAHAMGDLNPRFRSENILSLELDLPERTTFDYDPHAASGDVQDALNLAFPLESDVMFVGNERMEGLYVDGDSAAPGQLQRPRSSGKPRPPSARPASGRQRPSSARRKA